MDSEIRNAAAAPIQPSNPLGRIVIFKDAEYRRTPSDRLRDHLVRAGWAVDFIDPGLRPALADLKSVTDDPPTAVVRWEEQGCVFKNQRWIAICAWCYDHDVAPLSVDYGYFDHFRTLMLDRYLPDGSSAIAVEWDAVPADPIDWSACDPRLRRFVWLSHRLFDRASAMPPLAPKPYVAVFLQYSPALCRLDYSRARGANPQDRWTWSVHDALSRAGLRAVYKRSPLNPQGTPSLPDDVPVYDTIGTRTRANRVLNLRLAAHAEHVVMNCSSVAAEFVLNGLPVVATGRSWFVRAPGVFHEPETWKGVAACPPPDPAARNRWVRWWLQRQGYAAEIPDRLDAVLRGFWADPARKRRAPTIVSLPRRLPALLANDTRREAGGKHLGCRANVDGLVRLLAERGVDVVDALPVGALDSAKRWDRLERAELVVVNGEGSIHSGNRRAQGLLRAVSHCRKSGVPVWLVDHLAWRIDNLTHRYADADYVAGRDVQTVGYLAGHGVCAELAADCAFLTAVPDVPRENALLVCAGLAAPPADKVAALAEAAQIDRIVYLNDFYPAFDNGIRNDSVEDCLRRFAGARFVISSSYHGCIFATLCGVPFVPIDIAGHPPKQRIAAVESLGFHAVRCRDPRYLVEREEEIRSGIRSRLDWFRRRARLNVPEGWTP